VRYATTRQLTELRQTANIHYWHPAAWRSVAGMRQSTLYTALSVLSMEKDILDKISDNDIVDKFASCSQPLQKQLMHSFHV